jgi:hypothetical protein
MWTVFADTHSFGPHGHAIDQRWWHEAWVWLGRAICGLRGHDLLLHFESQRICLQCSTCGHQTPGWQLAPSRQRTRRMR